MSVYTYFNVYVCLCTYVCVCVCVRMYMCVLYIDIYICVCVCVCKFVYIQECVNVRVFARACERGNLIPVNHITDFDDVIERT